MTTPVLIQKDDPHGTFPLGSVVEWSEDRGAIPKGWKVLQSLTLEEFNRVQTAEKAERKRIFDLQCLHLPFLLAKVVIPRQFSLKEDDHWICYNCDRQWFGTIDYRCGICRAQFGRP